MHALAHTLPRLAFPFNENAVSRDGIYILFEKGERAHGGDRIVRVGTHTGEHQLRSRLQQHFINENKDRSIFRKNIGRCLLHKMEDPFLSVWELDLTSRIAREHHGASVDFHKQKEIEKSVTTYIQKNFSFVTVGIETKDERLILESQLISTISLCEECAPSSQWLGNHSPKEKIRESGLWLVNELYKQPLSERDIKKFARLIRS